MKKLILSLIVILGASFTNFAQTTVPAAIVAPDPNAAIITFETTTLDYGTIKQNSDPFRTIKFTNTGKSPLIIAQCDGSCGCTVPTCPSEPIMPGEKGEIQVRYATDRLGAFNKTVTVKSNAGNGTMVITIKGVVEPAPAGLPENNVGPTAK